MMATLCRVETYSCICFCLGVRKELTYNFVCAVFFGGWEYNVFFFALEHQMGRFLLWIFVSRIVIIQFSRDALPAFEKSSLLSRQLSMFLLHLFSSEAL